MPSKHVKKLNTLKYAVFMILFSLEIFKPFDSEVDGFVEKTVQTHISRYLKDSLDKF